VLGQSREKRVEKGIATDVEKLRKRGRERKRERNVGRNVLAEGELRQARILSVPTGL
jgi:hypothetical protein